MDKLPSPYGRKQFTGDLQKKIEDALDRQPAPSRRRAPLYVSAAAALAVLLLLPSVELTWKQTEQQAAVREEQAVELAPAASASSVTPEPVHSVLLIGLRADYTETDGKRPFGSRETSAYRTLLVAERDNRLQTAAEGSGILMPYGQQFWKIETATRTTPSDVYQSLSAKPVSGKAANTLESSPLPNESGEPVDHSEKLLFAGNKYVTVSVTDQVWQGNAPARSESVWTRELRQLNAAANTASMGAVPGSAAVRSAAGSASAAGRSFVALSDIFGAAADEVVAQAKALAGEPSPAVDTTISGDNWAVTRKPGKWTAQIAALSYYKNSRASYYDLLDVPLELPQAVVSHDTLDFTWDEIKAVRPEAIDAVSSPDRDMIAIVTPQYIFVHPLANGKIAASTSLRIDLNRSETLVMAQWATEKKYTDDWIAQAKANLRKAE